MSRVPVLHEYESTLLELTRTQAESLQRTGVVEVRPDPGGAWRVTASSKVGTLVVAGIELLIRPKISPDNLFLLLEPGVPASAWREESFDYDVTSDLLPAVIGFFTRTVETTLGRGVLRSYVTREQSLVTMRGRFDVAGQVSRGGVLTPVACSFDEFSEDIIENRTLRAAIRLALRVPGVAPADRQRLLHQLALLDGVDDATVAPESVDAIPITRLNEHYGPALGLARLLLANLTLADTRGMTSGASFIVDMNDLFQRFVTGRLRKALRGSLAVDEEPTVHLAAGRAVPMYPDLVFRTVGGSALLAGDVKYKVASDARGLNSDYYQILAYTTALDVPTGVLIYCRRTGDAEQREVSVLHSGKRLLVRAIDLSGTADQVEREITALSNVIRDHARKIFEDSS